MTTTDFQDVIKELDAVQEHLRRRIARRAQGVRHVALEGDFLPALRTQIDQRIDALADESEDDGLLALIADLIEYRIALWNEPVAHTLADPAAPPVTWDGKGSGSDIAHLPHVHTQSGLCLKNRTGPRCAPSVPTQRPSQENL